MVKVFAFAMGKRKYVVAMLKEIGVEGVETQYQVDLLREMDCDVAQDAGEPVII